METTRREASGGPIAFVAGATGFTGREVVRLCCERGIETHAHVRPDSPRLDEWRERFAKVGAMVDATRWEEERMAATLRRLRPTLVFALLGTTRERARADATRGADSSYQAIDYGLTALLYRAAAGVEPAPRFVYLSSAGVRESSAGSYMQARFLVEKMLREGALPYTIARPSFIVGERDEERRGERIGSAISDGGLKLLSLFGGERVYQRYRSTSNTALAEALVRLALDPTAAGAIIESEDLRQG